jgi:hypothetical protein
VPKARLELLAGALFESVTANRPSAPARMDSQLTPLRRRIERAVQLIETDYARPITLGDLASVADSARSTSRARSSDSLACRHIGISPAFGSVTPRKCSTRARQ